MTSEGRLEGQAPRARIISFCVVASLSTIAGGVAIGIT
jgi:hypothetical protein